MHPAIPLGSFQYPASNDSRGETISSPLVVISKTLLKKVAHIIMSCIYPDHTGYVPSKKLF
jgi:hypothetical protein